MKKIILITFLLPVLCLSQSITEISKDDFENTKILLENMNQIIIKDHENSFINLYTYEYNSTGRPMLYIGDSDYIIDVNLVEKSNDVSDFNYVKVGNFFDYPFWIVANHYLGGNPEIYLINKEDNTKFDLVSIHMSLLLNSINFYENGYFSINFNQGCCDDMEGCNFGFSLFKINENNIQNIFSTSEWFANEIIWQNDSTVLIDAKKGDCDWDEYEEKIVDYKFLRLKNTMRSSW